MHEVHPEKQTEMPPSQKQPLGGRGAHAWARERPDPQALVGARHTARSSVVSSPRKYRSKHSALENIHNFSTSILLALDSGYYHPSKKMRVSFPSGIYSFNGTGKDQLFPPVHQEPRSHSDGAVGWGPRYFSSDSRIWLWTLLLL